MEECRKAVEEGRLSEEALNQRVAAILNLIVELRDMQAANPLVYHQEKLLQAAYETVVDGSVLLKNRDNVLPLEKGGRIAFHGERSRKMKYNQAGMTA